jgi:hypothetical protein
MSENGVKIWTAEEIKDNLLQHDVWVTKAVVAIFNYQTADEQASEDTKHHNNVGFNGVDGRILSSFAKQINNFRPGKYRSPLSPKQMEIARRKIIKYSGQLAKIANGEM